MNIAEYPILKLIPQRAPFVMVDQLVYSDEKRSNSTFAVTDNNLFVEDGVLREAGLTENIAQTCAARAGYCALLENKPVAIGYIGTVKNLEVFSLPKINDVMETEITIENQIFDVTLITGKIRCANTLLAQCEMKIFITQPK